jgi:ZIP family zinc transporter
MTIILIAIGAFVATFLGGLLALKVRDHLHLILGFSAGAVIGVAFFDLLPESINLVGKSFSIETVTAIVALGFVVYMVLERFVLQKHNDGEHCENTEHQNEGRGVLGATSLTIHSLLDGLGIGLAFHVSTAVGLVVAVAVLVHDFSDGINTVSMIIQGGGERRSAYKWLLADAVAPVVGIFLSGFIVISDASLGVLLAVFCGFFLYIGASDLLPESHHAHPTFWTTCATVIGVAVLYVAVKFAGI